MHTHTHTHIHKDLFKTEHFGWKCWSWMAKPVPGQKMLAWISTQQHCLSATGAAKWEEQTRMDGTWDKVAMHRQTDLSLSSSSSNSLWEEERGRCSRPPKVHTAGKEEMLSGLVEINHDSGTVALTHVGSPRELSEVGLEMAARKIDLVGVPPLARWPPKLLRGKACLQSCNVPSPPGSRSVSRAAPSTLSKAGGAEGAVHKGAWAARKALCPPALT